MSGLATAQTESAPLNAFPLESSAERAQALPMAGLTQPLRFTASFPWSPRQCATRKPYSVRLLLLFLCIVSCKPDNAQQQQKPLLRVAFLLRIALVIPAGFEPTTHSLEGCCSIQLSYGTIVKSSKSNTKFPITQTFRARFDFYCCASATWRGITHSRHLSITKTLYYTQTQNKGCQTLRLAALLANMLPRT